MKKDFIKKYKVGESPTSTKDTGIHDPDDKSISNAYQEMRELSPTSHYNSQGQKNEKVNDAYEELGELSPPSTYDAIH
jgi:hypothetical protein